MNSSYSKLVWKEVEIIIGPSNVWSGASIEDGSRVWCENRVVESYKALLVILAWGIWLVRNASVFEEKCIPPL
jgi:hypothetical protein